MVAQKQGKAVHPQSDTGNVTGNNTSGVTTGDLVKTTAVRFDDDTLAAITSWEDAVSLLGDVDDFIDAADLGAGFALLKDKRQLVGIPFLIVEWSFHPGAAGDFVSCRVITRDNRKLIVNDGGTGICDQLSRISVKLRDKERAFRGVVCKHGLRESEYDYQDADGNTIPAKTYYLDTSA